MGNAQSQGIDCPMPSFNEDEYEQLKTIVGDCEQAEMTEFIPVSTDLIKVCIYCPIKQYILINVLFL